VVEAWPPPWLHPACMSVGPKRRPRRPPGGQHRTWPGAFKFKSYLANEHGPSGSESESLRGSGDASRKAHLLGCDSEHGRAFATGSRSERWSVKLGLSVANEQSSSITTFGVLRGAYALALAFCSLGLCKDLCTGPG
jgi:hypothetical protein